MVLLSIFISSVYNTLIESEYLMPFSSSNVYLFRVLEYPKYNFSCYFPDEGEYMLKLIQNTEGKDARIALVISLLFFN